MKFKVFHANVPNFGLGKPQKFPKEYTPVAVVEAVDVDDAFRLTNSIDQYWANNREVEKLLATHNFGWAHRPGLRSTSVGDVVVDAKGDIHRCAMAGWKRIGKVGDLPDGDQLLPQ